VPVVTPTAAPSLSLIHDFTENVKEVLDKWKVSSGQPDHLMEWLDMGNRKMDHRWLQDTAALENLLLRRTQERPTWISQGANVAILLVSAHIWVALDRRKYRCSGQKSLWNRQRNNKEEQH
jgi:hypothetical protein